MNLAWNPEQYLRFADARTRAASDLLARVPLEAPATVVDLGCGPGNSTALLAARWPAARITGVDSSPEMLAAARAAMPELAWVEGDAASWTPEAPVDLIFANAVLQWVPNHEALLPRLMACLAPGGVLAVQMPTNHEAPAFQVLRDLAGGETKGDWRRPLSPEAYVRMLTPHADAVDLWETEYQQVMAGVDGILEWGRGTVLLPYLQDLGEADRARFLADYRAALVRAYPVQPDGRVLFPFKRLFIVARRA